MPDFKQIVREKLSDWNGPEREETIEELAGHMEDRHENSLQDGLSASGALQASLGEVGDWKKLQAEIVSAQEGHVTERARRILIPGMAALLICIVGAPLLGRIYAHFYTHASLAFAYGSWSWFKFNTPGWCLLVVAGAVGAGCSQYVGGSRRERVWAAEFPAIVSLGAFFATFVVGFSLKFLSEHTVNWQSIRVQLGYVVFHIPTVVACLVGALPFLLSNAKANHLRRDFPKVDAI